MNNTDREHVLRDLYNFVMDEGTGMIREDDINAYLEYVGQSDAAPPTESVEGVEGERPNEKLLIELINKHITGDEYTKYNPALHYFEQVPVEKIADAMEAYAATHPTTESEGVGDIDFLERECLDLRCRNVPTYGGDFDVQWFIIQHYQAKPHEREIGHGRTPREAIDDAKSQLQGGSDEL